MRIFLTSMDEASIIRRRRCPCCVKVTQQGLKFLHTDQRTSGVIRKFNFNKLYMLCYVTALFHTNNAMIRSKYPLHSALKSCQALIDLHSLLKTHSFLICRFLKAATTTTTTLSVRPSVRLSVTPSGEACL